MIALLPLQAHAYEWDEAGAPAANTFEIHICDADFTNAQRAAIEEAMTAWRAGAGEPIRGAVWAFDPEPDRANCGFANGFNEIYKEPNSDFDAAGHDLALARVKKAASGGEIDVVFNELYDGDWIGGKPSDHHPSENADTFSIGMVALHEFGHVIGFDHDDAHIGVMNSLYPNGGMSRRRTDRTRTRCTGSSSSARAPAPGRT